MRNIAAKDIQAALIRRYGYCSNNTWMCNCVFAGGECDFLYYTRSGYCHEIEIKISVADWNNDLKKDKWQSQEREKISYFWYAVPLKLWQKAPEWVKQREEIGILTIQAIETESGGSYLSTVEQRPAKKLTNTKKLTVQDQLKITSKTWYRYADAMREEARRREYVDKNTSDTATSEASGVHP